MFNSNPPFGARVEDLKSGVITPPWQKWFSSLAQLLSRQVDYTNVSVQVPSTGFTITMVSNYGSTGSVLTLNPAGTLATGTINLPLKPIDGQIAEVSTTATITALTVSGNGSTIKNAPTTLTAGSGFAYYYNSATAAWFRRY